MTSVRENGTDTGTSSRASRLRTMIREKELTYLMEAHDGLSARIAEVEGFQAIWASGLSMSTALGVRDSDEASWSQLLGVVEAMVEATTVPIVVDGDTGYGNFNTARRFVAKAERLGVAGVCLEDKIFPKMNSFVGDSHTLAEVSDFTAKIRACKDSQRSSDFVLVARVEALIAGRGLPEALDRAHAYHEAGADAIFIHSRRSDATEILDFCREWGERLPLVIAPTTYASTPSSEFQAAGVSAVIWANHSMRAAVSAMRRVCREIFAKQSVHRTESELASLAEVFELMEYSEIDEAERRAYRV
ncbi:phosphoenolpyruvate mutase (EC 5.4.2.9) [Actinoalloteichus cyanogriseus DSM 43889]|uniref:phosphoenolpyruvate mutase n=4 Tax=Actinoalloteichus TaxID=65496 RepID=A0ABT1JD17_ACTCY|nr:phosphoenolpyruvate mutase (EC 5.4.2.9) [Actinoalloteichus caeruleus DSM 43889]